MMCFGDIHESQMFPVRELNLAELLKNKFPFNRPLGINTTPSGVLSFVDLIIDRILTHHSKEILEWLQTPVKKDPVQVLKFI